MPFDRFPGANLHLPEIFKPVSVPAPPVYDTSASVHQLAALADYLSPDARAKRKAAVAKANYEYRMYMPGGTAEKNALWMNQLRAWQKQEHAAKMIVLARKADPTSGLTQAQKAARADGLIPSSAPALNPQDVSDAQQTMSNETPEDLSDITPIDETATMDEPTE